MGTIDSLRAGHVSFRCTSVDRIGTRGYVPGLQYEGGVVKFLLNRGFPIPSPAALNKAHERLVAQLDGVVASSGGLRMASFFTHLAARVVVPALTDLARLGRPHPSTPLPLTQAWRNYERELASLIKRSPLAA